MKRLFTILYILSFFYIMIFAQSGYNNKSKFVKMTPIATAGYFIKIPKTSVRNNGMKQITINDPKIVSFSEGQYITKSVKNTKLQGFFSSNIYIKEDSTLAIILPEVIVNLSEEASIKKITSLFGEKLSLLEKRGHIYYFDCKVQNDEDVFTIVNQIAKIDGVAWCKPNMYVGIDFCNSIFTKQYYLNNYGQTGGMSGMDINVIPAWNITEGNPNITVAVIDSGVDLEHEDLADNILPGYTVGDADGLGAPINWIDSQNETTKLKGHGTSCAGIIGAINNSIGIRGVASGIKLLPVNIIPNQVQVDIYGNIRNQGFATLKQIAEAIIWAGERADILSLSWSTGYDNVIEEAIQNVISTGRNGKGSIVVAASGNNYAYGYNDVSFPAIDNNVIAVGAIDKSGNICNYSQRGSSLDLVAFGGYSDIETTDVTGTLGYDNGNYTSLFGGTSAACPQVAGVAALMLSANPQLTENQVRTILQETARDLGTKGWDTTYGYGLVDAYSAVKNAIGPTKIIGPSIVGTKATYTVNDLTNDTYVTWSQIGNSYTEADYRPSLTANQPQTNAVTVNNYNKKPFSIILQATIHSYNNLFKPYTIQMPITGDGPLNGIYQEVKLDGTKGFTTPLMVVEPGYEDEECENYASPASDVFVWSNNFVGRNVSYTSPQGSGYCNVSDGMIRFEMPNLSQGQVMTFTVSGGGLSSSYQFRFASSGSSLYGALSINPHGDNKYIISINDVESTSLKKTEKTIMATESPNEWTLEIYDVIGGNKVIQTNVTGNSFIFDTSTLRSGMYAVRARYNGQTYSGKLTVK